GDRYGPERSCGCRRRSAVAAITGVRSGKGGIVPRMTIRTSPGRTLTPVAPRRADPLILDPGTIAPGRARTAPPLRREGPAKLTGEAKYADDLVFPGAWFGATIRSTDAHARFDGVDLDDALDWSKIVLVTAADIPGENI